MFFILGNILMIKVKDIMIFFVKKISYHFFKRRKITPVQLLDEYYDIYIYIYIYIFGIIMQKK